MAPRTTSTTRATRPRARPTLRRPPSGRRRPPAPPTVRGRASPPLGRPRHICNTPATQTNGWPRRRARVRARGGDSLGRAGGAQGAARRGADAAGAGPLGRVGHRRGRQQRVLRVLACQQRAWSLPPCPVGRRRRGADRSTGLGAGGTRVAQRNVSGLVARNIFFDMGMSRLNRPALCYVAAEYVAGEIEEDLLIYHILAQLACTCARTASPPTHPAGKQRR